MLVKSTVSPSALIPARNESPSSVSVALVPLVWETRVEVLEARSQRKTPPVPCPGSVCPSTRFVAVLLKARYRPSALSRTS